MSTEIIVLLEDYSTESVSPTFTYTEKGIGAGYHNLNNSLHTAVYRVDSFVGTIKLQGTLALDPSDSDWFDIENTTKGDDSTLITNPDNPVVSQSVNFTGNFVWIRAGHILEDGTIQSIHYNF